MNLYDFRLGNDFSDKMPKALERKKKLNFLKLKKKKIVLFKEHHPGNEKTAYRPGENICK